MAVDLRAQNDPNSPKGNPLIILAEAIERQTNVLGAIAANTAPQHAHQYGLAPAGDGTLWGTFCMACSEKDQHYVWPCHLEVETGPNPNRPPHFLADSVVMAPEGPRAV